jgi:hypothetical protein
MNLDRLVASKGVRTCTVVVSVRKLLEAANVRVARTEYLAFCRVQLPAQHQNRRRPQHAGFSLSY